MLGADGIASRTRSLVHGSSAPAVRYAGYTCWRLLTTLTDPPAAAVEQWGRGQRVGVVPLRDGGAYVFLTGNAPPGGTDAGDVQELRRRFHAFDAGRVALAGDAAHAMTPNLGQGAGQALEDVSVLDAVAAYARIRRPRVTALHRRSRAMGRVGQLAHPVLVTARDVVLRLTPASALRRQALHVVGDGAAVRGGT